MTRIMKNVLFAYAKNTLKPQISFAGTVQLIRFFVFTTYIVESLSLLNSKFHVTVRFLTDLFGNPNDVFFRDLAHIKVG